MSGDIHPLAPHAVILRMQALLLPVQMLVFSGH